MEGGAAPLPTVSSRPGGQSQQGRTASGSTILYEKSLNKILFLNLNSFHIRSAPRGASTLNPPPLHPQAVRADSSRQEASTFEEVAEEGVMTLPTKKRKVHLLVSTHAHNLFDISYRPPFTLRPTP